jgi:hypothetical protein
VKPVVGALAMLAMFLSACDDSAHTEWVRQHRHYVQVCHDKGGQVSIDSSWKNDTYICTDRNTFSEIMPRFTQ